MKIISWNVNGIRAVMKKGFMQFFNDSDADIYCIQETKIHDNDLSDEQRQIGALKGYKSYWFGAQKKGYSSVSIITRYEPIKIIKGINKPGSEVFDEEGRVITAEFDKFYLVNVYVPNSKRGLLRVDERVEFNKIFINYCEELRKDKPVVFCGDLNVAHKEIDLRNPKTNTMNAGFSIQERDAFTQQLNLGYIDTFRMFNQDGDNYTWWSYMHNARAKNIGWRIDYFIVCEEIKDNVKSAEILPDVMGSDHCPVTLDIEF